MSKSTTPEVWSPAVMLASALDAEVDDAIFDVVGGDGWSAFRGFRDYYKLDINRETTFEELDAVWPQVWTARGLIPPTHSAISEFIANYSEPLPDPQEVRRRLDDERSRRWAEHNRTARELKPVGIDPRTQYALTEVERVCGSEAADAARLMIERHNRDTWNMGAAAARKQRREECAYLVSARELCANFRVTATEIATMAPATAEQRSAALVDLADARELHRSGGVSAQNPVNRRWRTLDDLDKLPGLEWLVDKLLPSASLTHLVGMSQSLKSFIALDMALSLATGTPFAGSARFDTADPVPVLYVVGEGARGIGKRVRAWCQQRGIDRARVGDNFTVLEGAAQLGSQRDVDEVMAKVIETGARLVVFDTQARCTVGLEENSATDQGRAVARLDALIQRTGAAVAVLHHTTKSDPRNARGSVAWLNAVDVQLIAMRDSPTTMEVTIEVGKMKDDAVGGPYPFKAAPVALPNGDESLVIAAVDPFIVDPDAPIEDWKGSGSAYAAQMYALAQEHCIPGEGLTQSRLADIANDVVGTETVHGRQRPKRRVCAKNTATAAVKLLVEHQWLVVARRDALGHVFYEPKDYPAPNATHVSALESA